MADKEEQWRLHKKKSLEFRRENVKPKRTEDLCTLFFWFSSFIYFRCWVFGYFASRSRDGVVLVL